MTGFEALLFWAAALILAAAFLLSTISTVFRKVWPLRASLFLTHAAFVPLTALAVKRWIGWGHPPFVTLFESMITSVWFLLLIFILFRIFARKMSLLVLPVSLISFLLMGWASSLPAEATPLSAALNNVWLFIHASFATAGAAVFMYGTSLSILFLAGRERIEKIRTLSKNVPEYESLIGVINKFLLLGLIFWGVMIVSGSIWAHKAWGRYWGWDPIELWSLISWLIFGLLLHARLAFKIPQKLFCLLTIVATLTVAFALWGVGYVYETIHNYG